ncbi:hypothetical protein TcWFU_002144 [Taenia crassiceps]|uniref:Uncharacterized protein n=1 Tax=Taenia crassiceps TaxID=6207 RepID=A0ABR4QAG9_9CEST
MHDIVCPQRENTFSSWQEEERLKATNAEMYQVLSISATRMQFQRHFSNVQHAPFDPQTDCGLYIDLENLPPDTPTVTLGDTYIYESNGTIRLPFFVVVPMIALLLKCKEIRSDKSAKFIDDLDFRLVYNPTPENPDCRVCHLVRQLLTQRKSYEEALLAMYLEEPIIIFEVMREIWSRFSTKVLRFSERHVKYSKTISYISIPLQREFKSPMGLDYPSEFTKWPALTSICLFICCDLADCLPRIHFGAEPYFGRRRGRESQIENDDADDDDDNDDKENSDCNADDSHEGELACPKSIACQALLLLLPPFLRPKK